MELIGRENLIVSVVDRFDCYRTEIWVMELRGTEMFNINLDEKGNLVRNKFEDELKLPREHGPLLSLPKPFATKLFEKLQEEAKSRGIKPKEQSFIEGKLEAAETHLQDMRKMAEKLIDFVIK